MKQASRSLAHMSVSSSRITRRDRLLAYLWLWESLYTARKSGIISDDIYNLLRTRTTLEWSRRSNKTFGLARYKHHGREMGVTLSSILWQAASKKERRETVYHEVAHIIVYANFFHKVPRPRQTPSAHGLEWQWVMRMIGYPNPSSRHTVANSDYESSVGNVPIYCGCDKSPMAWVSKLKAAKYTLLAQKGHVYQCRKCRQRLVIGAKK